MSGRPACDTEHARPGSITAAASWQRGAGLYEQALCTQMVACQVPDPVQLQLPQHSVRACFAGQLSPRALVLCSPDALTAGSVCCGSQVLDLTRGEAQLPRRAGAVHADNVSLQTRWCRTRGASATQTT